MKTLSDKLKGWKELGISKKNYESIKQMLGPAVGETKAKEIIAKIDGNNANFPDHAIGTRQYLSTPAVKEIVG